MDREQVKQDYVKIRPFLVPEKTAAQMIGVSYGMLVAGRFKKQPLLPFVRIGTRTIRYRVSDIEAYTGSRINTPEAPTQPTKSASPTL